MKILGSKVKKNKNVYVGWLSFGVFVFSSIIFIFDTEPKFKSILYIANTISTSCTITAFLLLLFEGYRLHKFIESAKLHAFLAKMKPTIAKVKNLANSRRANNNTIHAELQSILVFSAKIEKYDEAAFNDIKTAINSIEKGNQSTNFAAEVNKIASTLEAFEEEYARWQM